MPLARLASFVHKWLALLVGIQIVFWVVSGLFFTIFPIQQIRSENLIRPSQAQTLDTATLASLASLHGDQNALPTKLTIERRPIGQVVIAEFAAAQQAAQTGSRLIDRELNVRPTLRIRAGARVRVLVSQDIHLRPYPP